MHFDEIYQSYCCWASRLVLAALPFGDGALRDIQKCRKSALADVHRLAEKPDLCGGWELIRFTTDKADIIAGDVYREIVAADDDAGAIDFEFDDHAASSDDLNTSGRS